MFESKAVTDLMSAIVLLLKENIAAKNKDKLHKIGLKNGYNSDKLKEFF